MVFLTPPRAGRFSILIKSLSAVCSRGVLINGCEVHAMSCRGLKPRSPRIDIQYVCALNAWVNSLSSLQPLEKYGAEAIFNILLLDPIIVDYYCCIAFMRSKVVSRLFSLAIMMCQNLKAIIGNNGSWEMY